MLTLTKHNNYPMKTIKQFFFIIVLGFSSIIVNAQCPTVTNLAITYGANGSATVTPTVLGPINPTQTAYNWSIYGGGQSSTINQNILNYSFSMNTSYSVCLTVSDSSTSCPPSTLCALATVTNVNTSSSCHAAFTSYTDSNCVTHFVNSSTGNNLTYQWYNMSNNFNLFSSTTNTNYSFTNGTYLIALYAYSNGAFCDSITQVVTVNCAGGSTNTACQASFSSYTDSNCVTHFINTSTGNNISSSWTVNNICYPPSSSSLNLSLANGTYPVMLQIYSNGQLCDTLTQNVVINCNSGGTVTPTGCQANSQFYIFADSLNTGNYFAYNLSSGSGSLSYLWNFGDGTSSTQQYPFHQYAVPGQYVVCLTTTATYSTALGGNTTCTDTYCDSSSVHRIAAGFLMHQINVIAQSVTSVNSSDALIGLIAYPNPIADELTIEATTKNNTKLNYILIDALGRIILTGNIENSKVSIHTNTIAKGFYSLNVTDEKGQVLKAIKLVK